MNSNKSEDLGWPTDAEIGREIEFVQQGYRRRRRSRPLRTAASMCSRKV